MKSLPELVEFAAKKYNSKIAIEAGANILVSGTTIFKSNNGDIKKNIELLRSK